MCTRLASSWVAFAKTGNPNNEQHPALADLRRHDARDDDLRHEHEGGQRSARRDPTGTGASIRPERRRTTRRRAEALRHMEREPFRRASFRQETTHETTAGIDDGFGVHVGAGGGANLGRLLLRRAVPVDGGRRQIDARHHPPQPSRGRGRDAGRGVRLQADAAGPELRGADRTRRQRQLLLLLSGARARRSPATDELREGDATRRRWSRGCNDALAYCDARLHRDHRRATCQHDGEGRGGRRGAETRRAACC